MHCKFLMNFRKYLEVSFRVLQACVGVGAFDRASCLLGEILGMSLVFLGQPKQGVDGLLI